MFTDGDIAAWLSAASVLDSAGAMPSRKATVRGVSAVALLLVRSERLGADLGGRSQERPRRRLQHPDTGLCSRRLHLDNSTNVETWDALKHGGVIALQERGVVIHEWASTDVQSDVVPYTVAGVGSFSRACPWVCPPTEDLEVA
jgi:hypothetical protein